MSTIPAFIIGATRSGGGKTTLTVGIIAALVRKGLRVQCFKCGPDFIDPTLHQIVSSAPSYNLDLNMMGSSCCKATFADKCRGSDVAVIEGVMGLFDGGEASTAALAKALDIPVVLIVDAASCAQSAAAMLKGFQEYDPELRVNGVIFNRIGSPRHRELIDTAVREQCRVDYAGYMERDESFTIPERHLGLHMGDEDPLSETALDTLARSVEKNIDLGMILDLSGRNGEKETDTVRKPVKRQTTATGGPKVRVGVARDEAFCFYYQQNFELMEEAGFELVEFSPIHDPFLPGGLDMLYFGGGYPENHGGKLCDNRSIREQILSFYEQRRPIYGECGGFMYLCRSLTDMDGTCRDMVGIFPFDAVMNRRLRRLGYRRSRLVDSCILGRAGDILHGHEFHYSDIDYDGVSDLPAGVKTLYQLDNNSHEGYSIGSAVGSYIHLHFGNTPSVLKHLLRHIHHQQAGSSIDVNDNT